MPPPAATQKKRAADERERARKPKENFIRVSATNSRFNKTLSPRWPAPRRLRRFIRASSFQRPPTSPRLTIKLIIFLFFISARFFNFRSRVPFYCCDGIEGREANGVGREKRGGWRRYSVRHAAFNCARKTQRLVTRYWSGRRPTTR